MTTTIDGNSPAMFVDNADFEISVIRIKSVVKSVFNGNMCVKLLFLFLFCSKKLHEAVMRLVG